MATLNLKVSDTQARKLIESLAAGKDENSARVAKLAKQEQNNATKGRHQQAGDRRRVREALSLEAGEFDVLTDMILAEIHAATQVSETPADESMVSEESDSITAETTEEPVKATRSRK